MEFRLLGRFQAEQAGRPVEVGRRRERCLLGVLLLSEGRVIPAERLVDLLWDGDAPETAWAGLRTHMSRLRTRLRSEAAGPRVVTADGGYLVEFDRARVDAHRFRALVEQAGGERDPAVRAGVLRHAIGLWRGPLLADVASPRLRERVGGDLAEFRLRAIEALADAELARGNHEDLTGELTVWCAEHPLRERLTGQLMLALYRGGRQADALAAYQRLRTRLADDLGVDPGTELRELYASILRGDAHVRGPQPAAAVSLPGKLPVTPAPAQLPAAPTCFTGRDDVLKALDTLLPEYDGSAAAVVISALSGVAGIGKTAVAVHWAHRVAERFPDGQLYVNLRGYDESPPLSPATAVEGFLRSLDVRLPPGPYSLDELSARYRTALAGRRVLVLLDNARSAEQVRPLLPGTPTCLVLVTSRADLAGLVARDGARRIVLDCLSEAEAVRLLERILTVERVATQPEAALDLVRRCGGLPLALRVVAEQAARRPDTPLRAVADELADSTRRLDTLDIPGDPASAVRGVFSWSYRALPERAARTFRLLGLHPAGDFGAEAASRLTGEESTTRTDLALLVDGHLLEPAGPDRYTFHDLVRLYAAERAGTDEPEPERVAAVRRLLRWYLRTATAAARVINPQRHHPPVTADPGRLPDFNGYDDALSWLDTERSNLVASVAQAAETGEHEIAWHLAISLWDLFNLRDYWTDWIATHETALSSTRLLGDRKAQAWVLIHLAAGYGRSGRYRDAMACLHEALAIRRELGDRRGLASIMHNLGMVYQQLGQFDEAMAHFRQSLDGYVENGHVSGQASAWNSIGTMHAEFGDHADALSCQHRSLALFRQVGNGFGEGDALHGLSLAYRELGRLHEAARAAEDALLVARQVGHRFGEAKALDALGHVRLLSGEPAEARRHWHDAQTILAELRDPMLDTVRAQLRELANQASTNLRSD